MKEVSIIGTGLAGSYLARKLAEENYHVTMYERRDRVGGNLADTVDEITHCRYSLYGPHIFHTSNDDIINFLNRFTTMKPHVHKSTAYFKKYAKGFIFPFNFKTIDELYNERQASRIKTLLQDEFPFRDSITIHEMKSSANECIVELANLLWENDYQLYTSKQWGIPAEEVDKSVLSRVKFNLSYCDEMFSTKYVCLPDEGYSKMIENMLNHENITVYLNTSPNITFYQGKAYINDTEAPLIIYTGAIDELFDYKYGELPYRATKFEFVPAYKREKTEIGDPSVFCYPDHVYPYTRITHYGSLPIQNNLSAEVYGYEYPRQFDRNKPEYERCYPVRNEHSNFILNKYQEEAKIYTNLVLCGRLAEFLYYDMDAVIGAAEKKLESIIRR